MNDPARFWVNDLTRYVRATNGDAEAAQAIKFGFREVTGVEFDTFRAKTRADKSGPFKPKSKRK